MTATAPPIHEPTLPPPTVGQPAPTGKSRALPDKSKGMHWSLSVPVAAVLFVLAAWLAFLAFHRAGYSRADVDKARAVGVDEGAKKAAKSGQQGDGRPVYYDYTKRLFHYPLSLMARQTIGPESDTDSRLKMAGTAIVADEALLALSRGVPQCSLQIAVQVGGDGLVYPHVVAPDTPGHHVPLLDCAGTESRAQSAPAGGGGS